MADDESKSEEAAEGGKKGGSSLLLILLVALVCLGAGAGGAFFLLGGGGGAEAAAPPEASAVEPDPEPASFKDRVFSLEPFVVNVTGEGYPRYLKLRVELETSGIPAVEELDARLAQVRDTIILMLSSKRLSDISDFEGKALLKDDLRDRINGLLEEGRVEQVLFTEFVVQ